MAQQYSDKPLTPKQERFVLEYLIDLNATRAASRAGYLQPHVQGPRLLANVSVTGEIEKRQAKHAIKLEISAERVLREYARIAFVDQRKLMAWGPDGVKLVKSEELTEDEAAAVAEVSETVTKDGGSIKLKTHSKPAALDSLAKHLNLFPSDGAINIDARSQTIYASDDLIAAILKARNDVRS